MRTIDIVIDRLGKVTLSDSLLGMVGEHNNAKLCVRSEEGFFSDADFFRMCFGRYETAALYPVDGVIEYLVPGAVTGSTTKSWQLAGYRFDGQTPSLVKKSEVAAFALLPSAQPQAEIDPDISGTIEEEIQTLSGLVDDAKALAQTVTAKLNQAAGYYVPKEVGKGLSSNDYTDAEKNKVASAISETDAKAAFAAKGKLTDCHGFDGAGIYSIPYNAANLPDGVSFPQDKNAMLVVTYSNNMSWTNYEYSMTLILPDGVVYTQQRMGEKDYASFTAWTRAYSDKQDKAWQTLANLTVEEGEEASSIKIALPDAITTCNELMIEVEFYVGSEKSSLWLPTFCFADVDKTKYTCWLGGGGNGSVAPGTKYYFELYGRVGDSRLLTFYGPANQHMHANSRATAYMARTSLGYRGGHSSYTCYLHMDIASNTFTAGTKVKLLGR